MAKTIDIEYQGETVSFAYKPIDRKSLYGFKKRVAFDANGKECIKASLLNDGSLLIRSGMTAQGYFKPDGTWVPNSDIEAINIDGSIPEMHEATIGVAVPAKEITPEEALSLRFSNTYYLDAESLPGKLKDALSAGKILSFPFNPKADYNVETGILVANENGYFALIGDPVKYEFTTLQSTVNAEAEADNQDDELDFEMF